MRKVLKNDLAKHGLNKTWIRENQFWSPNRENRKEGKKRRREEEEEEEEEKKKRRRREAMIKKVWNHDYE